MEFVVQGDQTICDLTEEVNILRAPVLTSSDIERELITFPVSFGSASVAVP